MKRGKKKFDFLKTLKKKIFFFSSTQYYKEFAEIHKLRKFIRKKIFFRQTNTSKKKN